MELQKFLDEYKSLVGQIDKAVSKVKNLYKDEYKCDSGCTECCYSVFDITLIEAIYIKQQFNEIYSGEARYKLIEKCNKVDRQINRMKKEAVNKLKKGDKESKIIELISKERIECPLLSDNQCQIYEFRPIACRISGIPAVSHGMTHICGKTAFVRGSAYQTINMDSIYEKLFSIGKKMLIFNKSKFKTLNELLIPVSMAIITDFESEFLGIENNG